MGQALRILCLQSTFLAGLALPAAEPPSSAPYPVSADDQLFASPTRLDRIGRVVAPVMVDGRGPFRFIVDTGATHSTIAPHLAKLLKLEPAEQAPVLINGITGTA